MVSRSSAVLYTHFHVQHLPRRLLGASPFPHSYISPKQRALKLLWQSAACQGLLTLYNLALAPVDICLDFSFPK